MQGTIENMLSNQEQLTSLRGKTDAIAGQSKGFYRDAKTNRQKAQCEDMQCKLLLGGAAVLLFFFLFGGWIFGGDEEDGDVDGEDADARVRRLLGWDHRL